MASTDRSILARVFSPGPTRDNHPASGSTGKAGRNLPQAITTAVVLIAAVAVPLFTSLPAFVGVIAFVCLVGIWELAGAFARMGITLTVTPLYVGSIGMVTCAAKVCSSLCTSRCLCVWRGVCSIIVRSRA